MRIGQYPPRMSNRAIARFLMCRPEHFAVSYVINPWMDPQGWASDQRAHVAACRQWTALHNELIALGASVELVPPVRQLPDLVFTANAAVVLDRQALLTRFRHAERREEEPHFAAAFLGLKARGLIDRVRTLPPDVVLEGAGDCVWDAARRIFWMGFGPRSDLAAKQIVTETFGQEVVAIELADPRFYHMDTALCPLSGDDVMYFPGAFTKMGLGEIRSRIAPGHRIEIGAADAARFAANAVSLRDTVVLSGASERLKDELTSRGYKVVVTPLDSFLRSGGSAFCLTLRLDRTSVAVPAVRKLAVGE